MQLDKLCISAIYDGNRKCLTPLSKCEGRKDCKKLVQFFNREISFKSLITVDSLAGWNNLVREGGRKARG